MPRSSDAKERLIETAATLFRRHGFTGVGLTRILEESGAPKGSFYHHFPDGKDDLAVAAVAWAHDQVAQTIERAFAEAESFEAGAASLSRKLARLFEGSGFQEGCPITSVLLEKAPASEPIAEAVRSVFERWIDRVADHARRLGAEGDPRRRAEKLFIALEGAWILARARRSPEPILLAAEMC